MSQENVETCLRSADAFNRRDVDAYLHELTCAGSTSQGAGTGGGGDAHLVPYPPRHRVEGWALDFGRLANEHPSSRPYGPAVSASPNLLLR